MGLLEFYLLGVAVSVLQILRIKCAAKEKFTHYEWALLVCFVLFSWAYVWLNFETLLAVYLKEKKAKEQSKESDTI